MSFDDALILVMAQDGRAMKTESMLGYVERVPTPSGSPSGTEFGLAFRYRGSRTPFPGCPVYLVSYDEDEDLVVAATPQNPASLNSEFMSLVLADDWYVSTSDECEAALNKVSSTRADPVDALLNVIGGTSVDGTKTAAELMTGQGLPDSITLQQMADLTRT